MQVKIRQLRAFDAAVRLGSFVEAAKALHVTPAALSLAIRELEECVGFRVLERTTRRLRLSEAGRGYLGLAERVLSELDAAERFARDVRAGHALVRIATTQTVIATLLPHALQRVRAELPNVRLQLLDVTSGGINGALLEGQADMAIGVGLPSEGEFESTPLFTSRWFGFMAPTHPLASRRQLSWGDLANQSLYMTKSSNYLRLRAALGNDIDFVDTQESTATAGVAMASAGPGIAVFPGYTRPLAKVLGVKGVPIVTPFLPHELLIGMRRQRQTPAPLDRIRDTIAQAIAANCGHLY